MRIEGKNGTILFLQKNNIKIVKVHGTRENEELIIPFPQISSIEIKKPGFIRKGYIQFKTTSIMQRFIWFRGDENYKTAIDIRSKIFDFQNNVPIEIKKTINFPKHMGEYILEQSYNNVSLFLSENLGKISGGEPLSLVVESSNVSIYLNNKRIGIIQDSPQRSMIMNFIEQSNPVKAALSYYDGDRFVGLAIGLYAKSKYFRLLEKNILFTYCDLIGTAKFDHQAIIKKCYVGDVIEYEYDPILQNYAAIYDGNRIGFFPAHTNNYLSLYPSAFISRIDENDKENLIVTVGMCDS